MRSRWIFVGMAAGLALVLTVGFAFGSSRSTSAAVDRGGNAGTQTDLWTAMDVMHDSPAMQRIHAQMPEELQALCQAMHEQMRQMMGAGGMISGGMGSHHSGTTSDGMMDGGSGTPGGMIGPASGTMMGS